MSSLRPSWLVLAVLALSCGPEEPCADALALDRVVADEESLELLRGVSYLCGGLELRDLEVSDLDALSQLRVIHGSLQIHDNPGLESLAGLESLEQVGLHLSVVDNPGLRDLEYPALLGVVGDLSIHGNPIVERVDLPVLTTVGGDLSFHGNGQLRALSGPPQLREIDGKFIVSTMGSLESLELPPALESVTEVSVRQSPLLREITGGASIVEVESVDFSELPALERVAGLPRTMRSSLGLTDVPLLTDIGDWSALTEASFFIRNTGLEQIQGFSALRRSPDFLAIIDNAALADLGDLHGLEEIDVAYIYLNPELPPSQVEALLAEAEVGRAKVGGNAGESTPYDPCPWEGDIACDQAEGTGLCLIDSDCP